jgi:hypothetical protein
MALRKSNKISLAHKLKGNELFSKCDFHDALIEYNKVNLNLRQEKIKKIFPK